MLNLAFIYAHATYGPLPRTDFNKLRMFLGTNDGKQYTTNSIAATLLIGKSLAEIFDPSFDSSVFV